MPNNPHLSSSSSEAVAVAKLVLSSSASESVAPEPTACRAVCWDCLGWGIGEFESLVAQFDRLEFPSVMSSRLDQLQQLRWALAQVLNTHGVLDRLVARQTVLSDDMRIRIVSRAERRMPHQRRFLFLFWRLRKAADLADAIIANDVDASIYLLLNRPRGQWTTELRGLLRVAKEQATWAYKCYPKPSEWIDSEYRERSAKLCKTITALRQRFHDLGDLDLSHLANAQKETHAAGGYRDEVIYESPEIPMIIKNETLWFETPARDVDSMTTGELLTAADEIKKYKSIWRVLLEVDAELNPTHNATSNDAVVAKYNGRSTNAKTRPKKADKKDLHNARDALRKKVRKLLDAPAV
jgi:hypothetical protein